VEAIVPTLRRHLPSRRASETLNFECGPHHYIATISFFAGTGRLAEIFISNAKVSSHSDSAAKDAAVVCSIALQHGVPVDVIRHALLHDAQGRASSPLGAALIGAHVGDTREYQLPDGGNMKVALVSAEPFRS
jgi:hypothetical protein